MKRFLSVVMVLCLLFSLAACVKTPVKLDAPQNVKASDSALLSWDAVANATGYVVTIDGQEFTTNETSFQAPNAERSFNFTVKAVADGYDDSDETASSFTYVPPYIPPVEDDDVMMAIVGASDVRSNQSITLKARINGVATNAVVWQIVEGSDYIESVADGVVKAKKVDSDHIVRIKATSTEHEDVFAEKVLTVLAKTELTQAMLDVFNGKNKVSFEGYINIALFTMGATGNVPQGNYVNTVQTSMDGENWYAKYDSTGTGVTQGMYVKKKDGLAQQIQVSLMNDEEYVPIKDDDGSNVAWADSGMYNSFNGLSVDDFYFDETAWQWTYKSTTDGFIKRVVASANPYEFEPINLTLIIEDGEIMGIHSKSAESRKVVQGYIAQMDLYVAINFTDTVEIPTISKYVHEEIHDELDQAIKNMRSLTSYKVDFVKSARMFGLSSPVQDGFEEIVTPNECYFRSYDLALQDGEVVHKFDEGGYGFRKISDEFYNSYAYSTDTDKYHASRAYNGKFANAKASFMFAPELFNKVYRDEETGEITYYVDEIMCQVATTWYCAPGTDMSLYGLFATNYLASIYQYEPYVTVKDGYITEAGFFFNMSEMYGNVIITFSDFNAASLDEDHLDNVKFETRQIPTAWSQLDIEVSKQDGQTETETTVNAAEYLNEKFGSADAIPFFGNVLGDCFGFAMTTSYMPSHSSRLYSAVMFYYDVPVDLNYTLDSSMNVIKQMLIEQGFTPNGAGEYSKNGLWIAPTDDGLDLKIYVWQVK